MATEEAIYSTIILEILSEKQNGLTAELKKQLSEKPWLFVSGRCISPREILTIKSKELRRHLEEIVELSAGEFIGESELPPEVRTKLSNLRLLKAFSDTDIINFVLSKPNPHLHAHIICDTLHLLHKNQKLDADIIHHIQEVGWLLDKLNNEIIPSSVIHFPRIEGDIEEILALHTERGYISSSQLAVNITQHNCFQTLQELNNFFIKDQQALKLIGELLKPLSDYWIGALSQEELSLEAFFKSFKNASSEVLPIWSIAEKLGQASFKKYILPSLLRNPGTHQLLQIMQHISNENSQPDIQTQELYNQYLSLAIQYEDFEDSILPNIKLISQDNKWQDPECLCWEDGDITTVGSEVILHEEQRLILSSFLTTLSSQQYSDSDIAQTDQNETNEEILRGYFYSWESLIGTEVIGAFLSLITGGDALLEALAQGYLGNRNVELVRRRLLGGKDLSLKQFTIRLARRDDSSREVRSVLGEYFSARLIRSGRINLLSIRNQVDNDVELEFFPFEARSAQTYLKNILFKATKKLVEQVYKVSSSDLETIWNDLIQSKQLDIQVARSFLLEGAPYVLRALGIHKINATINELLRGWDEKRHIRADLKHQSQPTRFIEEEIEQIIQMLSDLFESESFEGKELRQVSLIAVRNKVKEFGYYPTSIPFELFQNADDAVLELERITQDQALKHDRKQFVLDWNDREVTFVHWGRPINLCWGSNNLSEDYRKLGFDRDLEKMLTFNISDKTNGATGKFGLGFKSIHLACNDSQIISRDLAFTVLGGLLPSRLKPTTRNDLQRELKKFSDLPDGTLIRLFVDPDAKVSAREIITNFHSLANILLIFSKRIRYCKINHNQQPSASISWNPKNVLGMTEVEYSEIQLPDNPELSKWNRHKTLCFRTGEPDYASLLLVFTLKEGELTASLPATIPTFWVTAPTCKKLNLGFILNANFDVTTGRESLVEFSKHNDELAARIGIKLGEIFVELFQRVESDWQGFLEDLDLQGVERYDFWRFIWEELAVNWLRRENSRMRHIIHSVLGNGKGVSYLVAHAPCLPSGLWGEYQQLVLPKDVEYEAKGVLATSQFCFLKVAQWSKFHQKCQRNLVSYQIWANLKALLKEDFVRYQFSVKSLKLIDALQWEIGCSSPCVEPGIANQIGKLITRQFLQELEDEMECKELSHFLQQVQFLSASSAYLRSMYLLAIGKESPEEERRLAGFAPCSVLLSNSYSNSALDFFYACREQRISIPIDTLVEWVLQAQEQQHDAVYNYLLEGNRKDELAASLIDHVTGTWLEKNEWIGKRLNVARDFETLRGQSPLDLIDDLDSIDEGEDAPWDEDPTTDDEGYQKPVFTGKVIASNDEEFQQFARKLLENLDCQTSAWKGYIYHFTHVENAASILREQKLFSRNSCRQRLSSFADAAGQGLIAHTRPDVLSFARFYFRPLTPTQWHNELLGRRKGNIYALCPVPIFLRFNLSSVLRTHGRQCMVSDGNLASSSTQYGNSIEFLNQCFDFKNVFGSVGGKGAIFRASQQEFIVKQCLDLSALSLQDITVICRNAQDKEVLTNLVGSPSFYHERILTVDELTPSARFYHGENPHISLTKKDNHIIVQIEGYSNDIQGNLFVRLNQETNSAREVHSHLGNITQIYIDQSIGVSASQGLKFKVGANTQFSVHFQEQGKNWLIYTNELTNS